MSRASVGLVAVFMILVHLSVSAAETDTTRLPVREITVFKDGHAFVLHEGTVPIDDAGNVTLDRLPRPIIGTFWAYSVQEGCKLRSVTAGMKRVAIKRTALTLTELIQANVGKQVIVQESGGPNEQYKARNLGILTRSVEELEETLAAAADIVTPQTSTFVHLRVDKENRYADRFVPMDRIVAFDIIGDANTNSLHEEVRPTLTFQLDHADDPPAHAEVGMIYVQKGIRWIPSYRIDINDDGTARVELQATLLNELDDLENVTAHLVIGVPSFAFKETIDPIALQQTAAQLSPYFETRSQTAHAFSNAIMTQSVRMNEYRGNGPAGRSGGMPEDLSGQKQEDLFLFTVENITLKRGARITLPVTTATLPYEALYTLNLPFLPPPEIRHDFNGQQQNELARLLENPKAEHILRLTNNGTAPLTTAPALLLKNGKLLGQTLMTYTATGGRVDLTITKAVNLKVKHEETEIRRIADAERWNGGTYSRTNLQGTITITNREDKPVRVEVTRGVLGTADTATAGGLIRKLGWGDNAGGRHLDTLPHWWHWHNWPHWWHRFNGAAEIEWQLDIESGQTATLTYTWHYIWR